MQVARELAAQRFTCSLETKKRCQNKKSAGGADQMQFARRQGRGRRERRGQRGSSRTSSKKGVLPLSACFLASLHVHLLAVFPSSHFRCGAWLLPQTVFLVSRPQQWSSFQVHRIEVLVIRCWRQVRVLCAPTRPHRVSTLEFDLAVGRIMHSKL